MQAQEVVEVLNPKFRHQGIDLKVSLPETIQPIEFAKEIRKAAAQLPADERSGWFKRALGWLARNTLNRIDLRALLAGLADAAQASGIPIPDVVHGDDARSYSVRVLDEVGPHLERISDVWLDAIVKNANLPFWVPKKIVKIALDPFIPEVPLNLLRRVLR